MNEGTEYFKSLRDEIHLRIIEHRQLVWFKIITLGAAISFWIKNYASIIGKISTTEQISTNIYFVWIIPLAAVIFDLLIATNLRVINNIGYYIKNYIEKQIFNNTRNKINEEIKKGNLFSLNMNISQEKKFERALKEKKLSKELKKELKTAFKKHGFNISQFATFDIKGEGFKIADKGLLYRIKNKEERNFFIKKEKNTNILNVKHLEFGFWEEKAAQSAGKYNCYSGIEVFAIWLFTPISIIFACSQQSNISMSWNLIIGIIITIIPLIYLLLSIKMERRF